MKIDEYGRTNNNGQDIRSMNNRELSELLQDIKENLKKYPDSREKWEEWLNCKSR